MISKPLPKKPEGESFSPNQPKPKTFLPLEHLSKREKLHHGPNNVSRWMTWLPISLKNAAKCDKWYQLQNLSITESLNANGAWEKLFMSDPRACRISVSNKKNQPAKNLFFCVLAFFQLEPISGRNAVIRVRSDLVLLGSQTKKAISLFVNPTNLEKTTNA